MNPQPKHLQHTHYQKAYSLPKSILITKKHTQYQQIYSVPKRIISTKKYPQYQKRLLFATQFGMPVLQIESRESYEKQLLSKRNLGKGSI